MDDKILTLLNKLLDDWEEWIPKPEKLPSEEMLNGFDNINNALKSAKLRTTEHSKH